MNPSRSLCPLLCAAVASAALAGDLTPPAGPVAPTMKTLDEVEPRTPIHAADLPLLISAPGSYYLAEDIVTAGGGIAVAVSDVTIDLMGFTLEGGTGVGINFAAQRRCVVRNGTITGWSSTGIDASVVSEGVFEDLRVANCVVNGLLTGSNAQVRRVIAQNNGGQGISGDGQIADCLASDNGSNGITFTGLIEHCVAIENNLDGIEFRGSSLVRNCRAAGNGADGFNQPTSSSSAGATVEGCVSEGNVNDGFSLYQASTIRNSTAFENGAAGITARNNGNIVESNTILDNAVGLEVTGTDCDVRSNTVRGNTDNYDFAPGNHLNLLLCEIPESLDWPCAVTLAGSLTGVAGVNGVTITSDDVSIDLAGHTLHGVPDVPESGSGIVSSGNIENVTIRNGAIKNWGFCGVLLSSTSGGRHRVSDVSVTNTGVFGILVDSRSMVSNCIVTSTGAAGISVEEGGTVSNCSVSEVTDAFGIKAESGSRVEHCDVRRSGAGIQVQSGGFVIGNWVEQTDFEAIYGSGKSVILDNTVRLSSGPGISTVLASGSRIEGNTVVECDTGIVTNDPGVVVVRNTVSSSTTANFVLDPGTIGGSITSNPAAAGPWDNIEF